MFRKKTNVLGLLLLLFAAAIACVPLSYVRAGSASSSDFQMKGDTLVKYTGTAGAVSVPTSVKHIGKEAFLNHTELIKVELPGYIQTIDYNAFSGCTSLERINIPDTVTEIGNGAFNGCESLKSISLGKKLKKLGNRVFADCTSLNDLKINRENSEFIYDSGAIYSKDKTILYGMLPGYYQDVYKMPSSVTEIKSHAFWGCDNLKKVQIGSNVETIPDYAFADCSNLEKVNFSYSVRRIGLKAFLDCMNLSDTEIPMSVTEIHETAFEGCPKLIIIAEEGSKAAEYDATREKSNVAQSEYQDMSNGTEDENTNAESSSSQNETSSGTTLGQSVVVGGSAFVFIDNNRSKVMSGNVKPSEESNSNVASPEIIASNQNTGQFPKYTIVDNTKIASQAYYGRTDLETYEMPDSITEIGDFAFARSGLSAIKIPEGVTTIGYGSFYHCDNLADIDIPESVTVIDPSAFDKTKWMEERLSDRQHPFTIVGDGILIAYSGSAAKVTIPEGVKQIAAEVFKGKDNITSVMLPSTLLSIGEEAFFGCNQLVSVSGGDNVEEIKDRAFAGCPISTIKIPASVKKIGLKAYDISEAEKEDGTKIVVFLGKTLPSISYERTATRLVNENYREAILKDVRVAIVDNSISEEDVKGTVLDYDKGGFRGFVCSVEQPASGDADGKLNIKFCVMHEEDVNRYTIPKKLIVYGKTYEITNPEDAVVYASEEGVTTAEEGTVSVEISSNTLAAIPAATAEMDGSKDDYILKISDNNNAGSTISTAYRKVIPGGKIKSLQVYDISLYDAKTQIPISRLGKQKMTVTIPKPKGIIADDLKILCMDEDGQLEKVDSQLVTINGEMCVQFTAEHFSVYGIYN